MSDLTKLKHLHPPPQPAATLVIWLETWQTHLEHGHFNYIDFLINLFEMNLYPIQIPKVKTFRDYFSILFTRFF